VIHVLVTDDSATARELITTILRSDPDIEVVGEATDGAEAVELAQQLAPDVITMDINMPRMDGYEATKAIMAAKPTPIVVLTSLSNEEVVHGGLDILLVGALEIVQKPNALSEQGYQTIAEDLIGKVKAVSQISLAQ
jgi:two-component system, chemotaxis family, protein-glutamate methylesterase/glutaminase